MDGPVARQGESEFRLLGRDRYGRTLADVRVGGISLNEEMVRRGHAWVYTRYVPSRLRDRYENLEWHARREGTGLWGAQQRPVPPWRWRRH